MSAPLTLVNTETGELSAPTYGDVKASIGRAKKSLEQAAEEIVWQIENQAWAVLGYDDWNAMREAEYGGAAFMVPRAERPELVARLNRYLPQSEVAATAGVSVATVERDLASIPQMRDSEPPTITNARGQKRPASYTPRSLPDLERETAAAVEEFPDLAHYVETGRVDDAVQMASDLRRYRERGELDERLATLRRSIEIDKSKRDGTYTPPPMPKVCNACGQIVKDS